MNMPYHGLPRFLYPAVLFVFLTIGLLMSKKNTVNEYADKWVLIIRKLAKKIYFASTA